jgi:hypothetical protein
MLFFLLACYNGEMDEPDRDPLTEQRAMVTRLHEAFGDDEQSLKESPYVLQAKLRGYRSALQQLQRMEKEEEQRLRTSMEQSGYCFPLQPQQKKSDHAKTKRPRQPGGREPGHYNS